VAAGSKKLQALKDILGEAFYQTLKSGADI